jgi:PleD family two-component response regulator
MLSKQGYTVLEARNAGEAFRHYQERGSAVDLLLTEALMSGVNGQELARVLEAKDPRLRVVYISDTDGRRLARRMERGTKPMMVKRPFTMRLLAGKVRQSLDSQQRRTAGAGA